MRALTNLIGLASCCLLSACAAPEPAPKPTGEPEPAAPAPKAEVKPPSPPPKGWQGEYRKAIDELTSRVKDLTEVSLELRTEAKMKENELARLRTNAVKAESIVKRSIAKYKEQKAEDPKRTAYFIDLFNPKLKFTPAEAKGRLRKWVGELKRKYAPERLKNKATLVALLELWVTNADLATESFKTKIQMLRDQLEAHEVAPDAAAIKAGLKSLAETGRLLGKLPKPSADSSDTLPEPDQLEKINAALAAALPGPNNRAILAEEAKAITKQKKRFKHFVDAPAPKGFAELEKALKDL